jgi:DNA adenine methylase
MRQFSSKQIKSPLNYIGGKYKILNQILPLFPKNIDNFVDLFAGGCNVGINADANKVYFNDNLVYLIEMYRSFQEKSFDEILSHIDMRIKQFNLSLSNKDGYIDMRKLYNQEKEPLDLFVLIAFSFNHQIRFNNHHEFNNPFGKERSSFNNTMKNNLEFFIDKLHKTNATFSDNCFEDFNLDFLTSEDLVYCDPPYLIAKGTYNDGKRGFRCWTDKEEKILLDKLDNLNKKNVKFALSNLLVHKDKKNKILEAWLAANENYIVHYIDSDYTNSNYQITLKHKKLSTEILVTNYKPQKTFHLKEF